jgi:hypothetical protein
MSLKKFLRRLERKRIISRKPHPAIPFILAFVSLTLGLLVSQLNINMIFSYAFFFLAGFSFVFAVLHLIVVRILE